MRLQDLRVIDLIEVAKRVIQTEPQVDRRTVLQATGAIGLTIGSSAAANATLQKALHNDPSEMDRKHRNDVSELFGVQNEVRFIPGFAHHKFLGRLHPADIRTLMPIAKEYFGENQVHKIGTTSELIMSTNVDASLFCAGGPVSNQVSRMVLQYLPIDPSHPELGLRRIREPIFRTRYELACSAATLPLDARQRHSGVAHEVPDWRILDVSSGQELMRKPGIVDHLLITVLPQVLDGRGYEHGHKIVLLAGGHGVGTLASVKLIRDVLAVDKLRRLTGGLSYWEALVPVVGMSVTDDGSTTPNGIDIVNAVVSPIMFDLSDLERAFQFSLVAGTSRLSKTRAGTTPQSSARFKKPARGTVRVESSPTEAQSNRSAAFARSGEAARTATPEKEHTAVRHQDGTDTALPQPDETRELVESITKKRLAELDRLHQAVEITWKSRRPPSRGNLDLAARYVLEAQALTEAERAEVQNMMDDDPDLARQMEKLSQQRHLLGT
ncbi:hypothetical protein ABH992_003285 [Bradyrhizobium yuanmingense]|uniref:Uncharacterized protein n=1 Tax=Bradyrhizobium yuanmingense TaxID=108015 RepID=A0ABV4GHA8_9BRAD